MTIIEALISTGLAASNNEARRLVVSNGASVNGGRVTEFDHPVSPGDELRAGKYRTARVEPAEMTLEQAIEVLNRERHRECAEWGARRCKFIDGHIGILVMNIGYTLLSNQKLSEFEAIAIATAYEKLARRDERSA